MLRTDRTQAIKWTAEGAVNGNLLVFCDVRHTLVVIDMLVSSKCTSIRFVNRGGTAGVF